MLLRHAQLFCEVCARRSFSDAARVLAVSQPTVSAAVLQIEKDLGVELLDRSSRPLGITPAGRLYEAGCRDLLAQIAALEERVREAGEQLAGAVKVAAIYSVGLLEIRTLVKAFEAAHPNAHVQLEYCHPDEVYERVRTGRADLGLVAFPSDSDEFASTLWQQQPMAVIAPPSHPLADRSSVSLTELADERFVTLKAGLKTRAYLDDLFAARSVRIDPVGQFDNFDTLRRAVAEGDGISIVPAAIVEKDAALGLIRLVRIVDASGQSDADLIRPLGIVNCRSRALPSTAVSFRDALLDMPSTADAASGGTAKIGGAKSRKRGEPKEPPRRPAAAGLTPNTRAR